MRPVADPALPPGKVLDELMERATDTTERLWRDFWAQAEMQAEGLRKSARQQAETIAIEAQREARQTLDRARGQADGIVAEARTEAARMISEAERQAEHLVEQFLDRLSFLLTSSLGDRVSQVAPPGREDRARMEDHG